MNHKIPRINFKLKLENSGWSWGQKTSHLKIILGTIGSSTSSWISELQVEVLKLYFPRLLGTMIGYDHKSLWHYLRLRFWASYSKRGLMRPGVVVAYTVSFVCYSVYWPRISQSVSQSATRSVCERISRLGVRIYLIAFTPGQCTLGPRAVSCCIVLLYDITIYVDIV